LQSITGDWSLKFDDDEVNIIPLAPENLVERARQNLGIRGELECSFTDGEEQWLEVGKLFLRDAEKSRD